MQLFFPAWVKLVSFLLESQEGTFDLFVGLSELNDAIAQADVAVIISLPCLPSLLSPSARDGTRLGAVLVVEGTATGSQDHVM